MVFQCILLSGKIPRGKEKDKAHQAVFLTPLNPFGKDPGRGEASLRLHRSQNVPYETCWKTNQNVVYWVRLKEAKDQGLQCWQTKSFAIMTYVTIAGDCIDRVTAQNGDRVMFERLATPRSAPKVTFKRNWQNQQQLPQQPIPTQAYSISGNRGRRGKARQKCKTTRNTSQKRIEHLETGCNPLLN